MLKDYLKGRRQAERNNKRLRLKSDNPGSYSTGVNRHAFPEFRGVSDEEANRIMQEHSDALEAERFKAEAWDKLKSNLEDSLFAMRRSSGANHSKIVTVRSVLGLMDVIYKGVEEDERQ